MKRHAMDLSLFVTVILLLVIGVMMVFSSSFYVAMSQWQDKYYFFYKDLKFALAGMVIMIVVAMVPYRIYRKFAPMLLVGSLILLGLVLTPVGTTINGAQRWIFIGSISIMPSEVAKICAIIFTAHSLTNNRHSIKKFTVGVLPYLALIGVYFGLIILQPNLSTAITIALIIMSMVFVAGARLDQLIGLAILGAGAFVGFAFSADYRRARVMAFLDPFEYADGAGWQVIQSLYALGSGGLFGVGIGQSIQNKLYIPEPQNDFIFATVGEEFGFIGCVLVIMLFFILIYRGVKIAIQAPDMFGSLIATGIVAMISFQVMINISVATSSMPVTGIPLPFISFGGSSLLILMGCMGILLNISQYTITD